MPVQERFPARDAEGQAKQRTTQRGNKCAGLRAQDVMEQGNVRVRPAGGPERRLAREWPRTISQLLVN